VAPAGEPVERVALGVRYTLHDVGDVDRRRLAALQYLERSAVGD
jgi:hypothetical protein